MNSRFKEDVQKLFEFWCEISPTKGEKIAGNIIACFPENFKDPEIINKIPEFAYPCNFTNESVQSYSFVLTSSDSKWRFGFCRHDPKTQTSAIIITYLPWHDTFLKFLNILAEVKKNFNNEFQPFLSEAYHKGVPEPGASLKLFYNGGTNNFMFQRPSQFQLPSMPENHNLNLYYNFIDSKNMIAIFAAMLAERRIIFTSKRFDKLSSCVQAANAFLYPMIWQHIFIPILPMKMKEILCAPMPFLIGVPEPVLETMTRDELGDVVILYCDMDTVTSPFDDVKTMPAELISQLKKQLNHTNEHIGDRISKIFLGILVQLIGGYRDAIKFTQGEKITWDRDTFIESRPPNLRPFLRNMMELQIFQQFIEERLEMLNTGLGFSDEFELETLRHLEKSGRKNKNYKEMLKNFKDKTNPAVKSAVQSVKQSSKGMKTAYKDLKLKLRDKTPPKLQHNEHSWSNQYYDGGKAMGAERGSVGGGETSNIDGVNGIVRGAGVGAGAGQHTQQHHSAPNSPVFTKRSQTLNSDIKLNRKPHTMLQNSNSLMNNSNFINNINNINNNHLKLSKKYPLRPPQVSPPPPQQLSFTSKSSSSSKSNSSSDMNLLQELQQHALFKLPAVDRSLKPTTNHISNSNNNNNNKMMDYIRTNRGGSLLITPNHTHKSNNYYDDNQANVNEVTKVMLTPHRDYDSTIQQQQQQQQQQQHQQQSVNTYLLNSAMNTSDTSSSSPSPSSSFHFDCSPEMPSPPVPPRKTNSMASFPTIETVISTQLDVTLFNNNNDNINHNHNICKSYSNNNHYNNNVNNNNNQFAVANNFVNNNDVLFSIATPFITAATTTSSSSTTTSTTTTSSLLSSSSTLLAPSSSSSSSSSSPLPLLLSQSIPNTLPLPLPPPLPQQSSLSSSSLSSSTTSKVSQKFNNCKEDDDNTTNLINLETNISYELEDFDPLNQNAKEIPTTSALLGPSTSSSSSASATTISAALLLSNNNNVHSYTNPVYPYFSPLYRNNIQHNNNNNNTSIIKPLRIAATANTSPLSALSHVNSLPTSSAILKSGSDDDLELLRKYGLDQFKLDDGVDCNISSSSSSNISNINNNNNNNNNNNDINNTRDRNNWTTFD